MPFYCVLNFIIWLIPPQIADAALSVAVGGAAGCFLGTDVSYGAANWMGSAIGIQDTYSPLLSSAVAGTYVATMISFALIF